MTVEEERAALYAAVATTLGVEAADIVNVGVKDDEYSVLIANNDKRQTARRAYVLIKDVKKPKATKRQKVDGHVT